MKHPFIQFFLAAAVTTGSLSSYAASPAQWQSMTNNLSVSLEAALEHAQKAAPGKPIEAQLNDGDGQGVRYEVEILTAEGEIVEVWVNGANGQTLVHEHKGKAKRKDLSRSQAAKIDIQAAIKSATAHTPGKVVKADLDNHWGTTTYQVDILQSDYSVMELKVDAVNGKVIRAKKD